MNVTKRDLIDLEYQLRVCINGVKGSIIKELAPTEDVALCVPTSDLRIVCAAIRNVEGGIIIGIRHYDTIMNATLSELPIDLRDLWSEQVEQGFVDQRGNFLTRKEAWKIASNAGQIIHRVGGDDRDGGTLYSENLY